MKTFCLIVLLAVTAGTTARAQSNTNTAPSLLRVRDIYSDSADFDWLGHTVTTRGNVRVIAADMKLTCALLIADFSQTGWHLNRAVAETNVVIDIKDSKGQITHVTGDKAVYIYNVQDGKTNETVTLTGNPQPRVENVQGTMAADVIVWDRANNGYQFSGNYHMVSHQEPGAVTGTNLPPATTNKLTAPKVNLPPGADTNFPPGKLDLAPPRHTDVPPLFNVPPEHPHGR